MSHVAIQGVKGSFHHEAANRLVPQAEPLECVTFQDVFAAVVDETADYGVVAIENSLYGSINPVYNLLDRNQLWIAGETTLLVEQYLIGPAENTLEALNTRDAEVRTMFPAFAQCELWLQDHLPHTKRVEVYDTAVSVRQIMKKNDPMRVAIAGKYAADTYGGIIIAGPINDDPYNHTRFVLLTKEPQPATDATRTSIILVTDHSEGSLYNALGAFAEQDINLSKLDSHPIPGDRRHYAFYIDMEIGLETPAAQAALENVRARGCTVKVLGSYVCQDSIV